MAIKYYSSIDLRTNQLQNALIHVSGSAPTSPTPAQGQVYYNSGDDTLYTYDGSSWNGLASSGAMTAWILEDDDGTEVSVSNAEEVKFIGSGITTNWTDTSPGSDADPFDMTFTVDATQTGITSITNTSLVIGRDADNDIDFSTDNNIRFRAGGEDQLTLTDGYLTPSSNGIVDLGTDALEFNNAFFDGTLEADAITIGGTNIVTGSLITTLGTISAGVWNGTAIASSYIAGDAITGAKIADDAIDSEHYTDGSIDNAHIADDAIDSEHYAAGSIDTAHIADDQVTLAKMAGLASTKFILGNGSGNPAAVSMSGDATMSNTGAITITQSAGDFTVTGDLTVSGDTTTVNTATLAVEDPLIKLATGNTSGDAIDIGFYGLYDATGSQDVYTGLTRDASDDKWHLWKLNQAEPTTTVNHSGTGFAVDTLVANLQGDVTGDLTGQADTVATIAGLAPNTATTQATQGAITSAANLATVGTIGTGVWQGTAVASAYLDADTAHLSTTQTFTGAKTFDENATLNGIVMDGNTITGVDDSGEFTDDDAHIMTSAGINDKFGVIAGSSSITTVGTIGTGTWQGTAVASAYLDADTAHLTTAQTFTGSKTMGTTVKLNFRDGNSYINSPTANDLEIVATDITLDAANSIILENDVVFTDKLYVDDAGGEYISGNGTTATMTGAWAAGNMTITGGAISGITDLPIADGGTGASTASAARTNLGLAYADASDVQTGTEAAKVITPDVLAAKSVFATIDVSAMTTAGNNYAEITHSLGTEDIVVQLFDATTKDTVYADILRTDKSGTASTSKIKVSFAKDPTVDVEVVITSIKGASAGSVAYA